MKLQTGLLYLDGRPASAIDSAEMLGEFASRHVDIAGAKIDGSLFIAYRGDRIAPEEDFEIQPLTSGPCTLTWDGRLDNREEIADRAGLLQIDTVSDPDIVLAAYHLFGDAIFPELIGEFALVLWSRIDRNLRFVRSTCGARTLYYVLSPKRLMWSSDFAHLVRVSGVDLTVNDEYVVRYLVSQPSGRLSPLLNVIPVPPNRLLRFVDGCVKHTRELWDPTQISPLQYKSDREYEEGFRESLTQAVRVRLRAKQPIFSELSGGLDSSSIVLIADKILQERGESPSTLQTISCVYETSRSCDESAFVREIEEQRGIESLRIHESDQKVTLGLENPSFTGLPNSLHSFPGRYQKVAELMRPSGARVLLTGRGGDHLCWSEPDGAPIVADELMKGSMFGAHRECLEWSQAAGISYYEFLTTRAFPLVLNSLWPQALLYKQPEVPRWISPKHQKKISHIPEFGRYSKWRSAASQRAQVLVTDHMFRYLASGAFTEYGELFVSHPFSHRPLVEFCLRTPVSQFLRNRQTRSLMRRALIDILPGKTQRRVSKGLLDETMFRALRKECLVDSNIPTWEVCKREIALAAPLRNALNQAYLSVLDQSGPFFRLISVERWLRSLNHLY